MLRVTTCCTTTFSIPSFYALDNGNGIVMRLIMVCNADTADSEKLFVRVMCAV